MKIYIPTIIIIILLLASCANPQPPSGGPPDKTPPKIISSEPATGTINYKGNSVTVEFSKYMDKNKVIDNIFISPSKNVIYNWSGKSLEIKFQEKLDSNTTYSIMLGTEYTDLKGNSPEESFNLIFSTGSHIDSGKITGKLIDEKPAGNFIYAYSLSNINPDTLNPANTKPTYKTQVGSTGKFSIGALKPGKYRIFVINDKFKDGIYDPGTDGFGAAFSDAELNEKLSFDLMLKLGPPIDDKGPLVYDIEAINERLISVSFSEPIDTTSVSSGLFSLADSINKENNPVLSAFISLENSSKLYLIPENKVSNGKWELSVNTTNEYGIRDTSGNLLADTSKIFYFFGTNEPDTNNPKLIGYPFRDSTQYIQPDGYFRFVFNTAIISNSLNGKIHIYKLPENESIPFQLYWRQDNVLYFIPEKKLQSDSWFEININLDSLKSYNGLKTTDTTLILRFKTADNRNYGGLAGIIRDSTTYTGNYLVILKSKETVKRYIHKANSEGKWSFPELPPGIYTTEIICDENNNGKYDYGNPFPFKHSEKFYLIEKELLVKPRWKVEDIIIEIGK